MAPNSFINKYHIEGFFFLSITKDVLTLAPSREIDKNQDRTTDIFIHLK